MSGAFSGSGVPSGAGREPEIVPASDRSVLVSFGDFIGKDEHDKVVRLLGLLDSETLPGVVDLSPAYASILVRFDPLATDHETIGAEVRRRVARLDSVRMPEARLVEVPVCYGGEFGPDLEEVARFGSIAAEEAIALHAGRVYDVFFLGFSPGFAYLGFVPESIACPRLDRPRRQVPAGSVGIAGVQTGVYPHATPGGWRIVGRTPLSMFDSGREPMSRLRIGDRVRFVPIDEARFRAA